MKKLLIVFICFINISLSAQIESYLKQKISPESVDDIVKLLNLKKAKKISIFSQKADTSLLFGEILLYENGKCFQKNSFFGNNTIHTYDENGNLIEDIFFSTYNSRNLRHIEYQYDDNGDVIEEIRKDESGTKINKETEADSLEMSIVVRNLYSYIVPRYKIDAEDNSYNTEYTYNADGYLVRHVFRNFYYPSSKSRADDESKENELEYKYEYNEDNQIISYYKKLSLRSTVRKATTTFNYINNRLIKVKSESSFSNDFGYDDLLLKIEYY